MCKTFPTYSGRGESDLRYATHVRSKAEGPCMCYNCQSREHEVAKDMEIWESKLVVFSVITKCSVFVFSSRSIDILYSLHFVLRLPIYHELLHELNVNVCNVSYVKVSVFERRRKVFIWCLGQWKKKLNRRYAVTGSLLTFVNTFRYFKCVIAYLQHFDFLITGIW